MKYSVYSVEHPVLSDDAVLKAVQLTDGEAEDQARVLQLRDELCAVAHPKYLLGECSVTAIGEDWVELDGERFRSPLLAKNLVSVKTVYPFMATCGTEAETWSNSIEDVFEQFWCDSLKLLLLGLASAPLEQLARDTYFSEGHMARMNPGSLPSWPLSGQRDMFRLLADGAAEMGVELTESCLMQPQKSVDGLYFHSEDDFVNCAFCTLLRCPTRRAPFVGGME